MIRPIAMFALIALAACAQTAEWQRADTPLAQSQRDTQDCQAIASRQVLDEQGHSRQLYPPFTRNSTVASGGRHGGATGNSDLNQGGRTYELQDYCMQQRGYHAVTASR